MLGRTSELWNVTGRRQRAPEMASRCDSGAVLSLLCAAFAASQVVNPVAGKYIKVECFAGITVLFVADGKGLRSFALSRGYRQEVPPFLAVFRRGEARRIFVASGGLVLYTQNG